MSALLLSLLLPVAAEASLIYPTILEEETEAACTPACTACHDSLQGGEGTVVQPFGEALMDRGLTGSDHELLITLIDEIAADGQDVDGDGISDVDELAAGGDPNPGDATFCDVELPRYGCFSHTGHAPGVLLALLAGLVTVLRSRR